MEWTCFTTFFPVRVCLSTSWTNDQTQTVSSSHSNCSSTFFSHEKPEATNILFGRRYTFGLVARIRIATTSSLNSLSFIIVWGLTLKHMGHVICHNLSSIDIGTWWGLVLHVRFKYNPAVCGAHLLDVICRESSSDHGQFGLPAIRTHPKIWSWCIIILTDQTWHDVGLILLYVQRKITNCYCHGVGKKMQPTNPKAVKHLCETKIWTFFYIFPLLLCQCTVDCGMQKRVECKAWGVKKVKCWVGNVVCRVWSGDYGVWTVKWEVWGGMSEV